MIKCPVCGDHVFEYDNDYSVCEVCGWENDALQYHLPDYWGGANYLSVNEARLEYGLLQNEITHQATSDALQSHRNARSEIYAKYKDIDYQTDGGKVYTALECEHSRYVLALSAIIRQDSNIDVECFNSPGGASTRLFDYIVRYNSKTNDFAVANSSGVLTMFKPAQGIRYYQLKAEYEGSHDNNEVH